MMLDGDDDDDTYFIVPAGKFVFHSGAAQELLLSNNTQSSGNEKAHITKTHTDTTRCCRQHRHTADFHELKHNPKHTAAIFSILTEKREWGLNEGIPLCLLCDITKG